MLKTYFLNHPIGQIHNNLHLKVLNNNTANNIRNLYRKQIMQKNIMPLTLISLIKCFISCAFKLIKY